MALGSKAPNAARNNVFVDLRFNAAKGQEGVGFRQVTAPASDGAEKQIAMHEYVEGNLVGFSVKEQAIYEDRAVKENPRKEIICNATFKDADGGPSVVVRFPLASSAGRKVVGLLNATKEQTPFVRLFTNFAETGTVIGDGKPSIKPAAYINMRKDGPKGEKIVPLYVDNAGKELRQESGAPAQLPMGQKVVVNKKEMWDFTAADEIAAATAATVAEYFASQREDHHEAAADAPADDGVDLNEAAEAAAPRG